MIVGTHVADAAAMLRLGTLIGAALEGGDCLALEGPLGAGKTTFVRGLAKGLDIRPASVVKSPSFALLHRYSGRLSVLHADFYRLQAPRQALELHPWDSLLDAEVAVVEWADRAPSVLPPDSLWVRIVPCGEGRDLLFHEPRGDVRWLTEPSAQEFVWTNPISPKHQPPSSSPSCSSPWPCVSTTGAWST